MRLVITPHAIVRFRERFMPPDSTRTNNDVHRLLMGLWRDGVPFGRQDDKTHMRVATIRDDGQQVVLVGQVGREVEPTRVITTCMTLEMAVNNALTLSRPSGKWNRGKQRTRGRRG
jgi:hypothetical protein